MSNSVDEYKNEQLAVRIERAPGCRTTFSIEVSPEMTKEIHRQAIKKINKQISLPGFRKGRAPDKLILTHYGQHVEKEWKEALLNSAFSEAMKLSNVYIYSQEGVEKANIDSSSLEEGSKITVKFESFPAIPEIDTEEIAVKTAEKAAVTEEKVAQIIEDIRYRFADWEEVEGRPVSLGDFVDVDIENLDEEAEEQKFLVKDTRLEVKEGRIGKWLIESLVGLSIGESKEALSTLEEGVDAGKFTPTNCRITLKKIVKSALPEIDDTLAEKTGLKSVDELKEKVRADLEKMEESRCREMQRELLKRAILEKYPFDIPASIAEPEAQRLMVERTKALKAGLKEGEALDEKRSHALSDEVSKEVNDYCRWEFITGRVAQKEGIVAEQHELVNRTMRYLYENREREEEQQPEATVVMQRMKREIEKEAVCDLLLKKIEGNGAKNS